MDAKKTEIAFSIAPDGNLTLAGIQTEDLGGLRAADIDHGLEIDTPSTHAMRMHEVYAFLYAGNPVWNKCEGVAAHVLLTSEVKWGMICADRDHIAACQRFPKMLLLFGIS